jgi:hypothetical protein
MTRDLKSLQRHLAELVRHGACASEDEWLTSVAQSTGLLVVRECVAAWRELILRRTCPLTSARLEARGEFRAAVARLLRREGPMYFRDLALAFLTDAATHDDPAVSDAAMYERDEIERAALAAA